MNALGCNRASLVAALAFSSAVLASQPAVSCNGGCDATPVIAFVNGAWDVTVRATGTPHTTVTITAIDGSTPIGNVRVEAGYDFPGGGLVALTIQEAGTGSIPFVRSVERVPHPFEADGELHLSILLSTGSLGPGTIKAERIVELRAPGGSQATVQSGPALFATNPTIDVFRCTSGSIAGSITVNGGGINDLFAGGDIGASNSLVSISTSGTIQAIEADSIYATINTEAFSGTGDLWSLRTSVGDFKGSLTTRRIDDTDPDLESGLDIAGSLDANISITGAGAVGGPLFEPIVVGGSFPSGRTLTMNGELRDNNELPNPPYNDQDGRLTIGGQLAGTVKIIGSLLGDITVGSSGNPGLLGQVIVNSQNVGGDWFVGSLRYTGVSGTALSKNYSTLPPRWAAAPSASSPSLVTARPAAPPTTPASPSPRAVPILPKSPSTTTAQSSS